MYATETYTYNATTGNLASKTGVGSYTYMDSAHKHAVTHLGGVQKYWYDANDNMTKRIVGADTFDLSFDYENHLTQVKKNGSTLATFIYDGDGKRVKGTVSGVTTAYTGNYFEWMAVKNTACSTNTMRKYYYAGGQRVAVRRGSTLSLLFGDHLGSTTYTADPITGRRWTSLRYAAALRPWGEQRYAEGTAPTEFHFTGQRELSALGLLDYGARWYDSALGRFIQPDTVVPLESQGVQAWDRFAYTNNNPVRYTDPTGHDVGCPGRDLSNCVPAKNTSNPSPTQTPTLQKTAAAGLTQIAEGSYSTPSGLRYQPDNTPTPTLPPTETPTPQPTVNPELRGREIETGTSMVNISKDAIKYAAIQEIDAIIPNPVIALTISASIQYYKDSAMDISLSERVVRAAVAGSEGVLIDNFSVGLGVTGGYSGAALTSVTVFGIPAGILGGYVIGASAGYALGTSVTSRINDAYLFPYISNLFR
jgi:RHS repeat-associated protein